jgi:hypothetical protein
MRDQTAKDHQKGAPQHLLAIACLLFIFGLIAQTVVGGKSSAFDRSIILAFREHGNQSAPIGAAWVQEAARDLTSLDSIIVLVVITLAIAGYLFLARKQAAAWLMLVALFGGIAVNSSGMNSNNGMNSNTPGQYGNHSGPGGINTNNQ